MEVQELKEHMARPSDREYSLQRTIKELKEQNAKLETENAKLKKQIEKERPKDEYTKKKPAKLVNRPCPDCGAEIKTTELPHANMDLCSAACGWRMVRQK